MALMTHFQFSPRDRLKLRLLVPRKGYQSSKFHQNVTTVPIYYWTSKWLSCHVTFSLSPFKRPFSRWIWVSWYQNVSILNFIGAQDDGGGGDNWSYKTCKAPVKSSPPTNQHPVFLQAGCPSYLPNNSVRALPAMLLLPTKVTHTNERTLQTPTITMMLKHITSGKAHSKVCPAPLSIGWQQLISLQQGKWT